MAAANHPHGGGPSSLGDIAHAAFRGAVGAMAMTGMRSFTERIGLIEETPPNAIVRQSAKRMIRLMPRKKRGAAIEVFHWSYGAGGGALFGALPATLRQAPWAGPVYGVAIWLGFEAGIAPVLGLNQAKRKRPTERLVFLVDHLLYGLVLSEGRRRPQS
ncbi:hypothetical protein BH24ACT23_BH24ACT23_07620 [soil metagenome]